MGGQVPRAGELPPADLTPVGLLSGVDPHVVVEASHPREGGIALSAFKRLGPLWRNVGKTKQKNNRRHSSSVVDVIVVQGGLPTARSRAHGAGLTLHDSAVHA